MWEDKVVEFKGKFYSQESNGQPGQRLPVVRFVRTHPDAKLPTRGSAGAVGYDVYAVEDVFIDDHPRLVPIGWKIAVEDGYEVQVRSRSGLALKGVFVVNSPGTIDPDYRGELGVIMVTFSKFGHQVYKGDRIAQLVVAPVTRAAMVEVDAFNDTTQRGEGGYGSSGVSGDPIDPRFTNSG